MKRRERSLKMEHNDILFDYTGTGEMICICDHCECETPHFAWYPRFGEPVRLMLEKAMTLEPCTNMELRDRFRLQRYLSFYNWHRLINAWNDHNRTQVSPNIHVPRYIDLMTAKHCFCRNKVSHQETVLGEIWMDGDDEDERPHFHFRRKNGTEEIIALTGAHYLEPVTAELSRTEKAALAETLRGPSGTQDETVYESMCILWDMLNNSSFFDTADGGDLFPMPDYMKLKKARNIHEQSE